MNTELNALKALIRANSGEVFIGKDMLKAAEDYDLVELSIGGKVKYVTKRKS